MMLAGDNQALSGVGRGGTDRFQQRHRAIRRHQLHHRGDLAPVTPGPADDVFTRIGDPEGEPRILEYQLSDILAVKTARPSESQTRDSFQRNRFDSPRIVSRLAELIVYFLCHDARSGTLLRDPHRFESKQPDRRHV